MQKTITGKTIYNALFLNHVPLIVTNSLFYCREDLPHWVVVTGIDDTCMYFTNPFDATPHKRTIELPALQKFVGYHGDQSMVEIWIQ